MDSIQIKSHARYLLLSNERRAAPAEDGTERRYFILRVGAQYAKTDDPKQKKRSKDYFDALYHEIDNGGTEAFLEALLKFDTSRVDLRNPPKTKALADQIEANLRGEEKWLFDVLASGTFVDEDGETIEELGEWENGSVKVSRSAVFKSYNAAVSTHGQRREQDAHIGKFLTAFLPDLDTVQRRVGTERLRYYVFPPLADCRAAFEQRAGVRFDRSPVEAPESVSAKTAADRWTEMSRIDVNPSDDLFYETGRLMQIDAEIDAILFPDARDGVSDGGYSAWFYRHAPSGFGISGLDRS